MPFCVRVRSPITPSRPTSQPAAVVTRNSAPGRGCPVALSRFWMISSPLGWFLKVRVTVRPSLIWTVWLWVSMMKPVRRASLRHHHALAGFQAGDPDLAVLIGPVDAVAVADQGAIRIHDLEFRVRAGSRWG